MSQYPNRSDITVYGLPANPSIGTIAVDAADGKLKKYNGTSWSLADSELANNIASIQTFDYASLSDFTQTGLTLSLSNPIRGFKSALLTHQSATNQSFKQIIAISNYFRGKNLTLSLSDRSTAYAANLTLLVYDETNASTLLSSQINTDKQAFTVNTASSTTISAIPSTVINYLAVGQSITGAGIPANTVIQSINTSAFTMIISNAATATTTGAAINTSGLPSARSFSFDVPTNCASLSYTITALPEANLSESYIDDVSIQLSTGLILPATVTVPKNNDTDWVNAGTCVITSTGGGAVKGTASKDNLRWRRQGDTMEVTLEYIQPGAGTAGTGDYLIAIPSGYTMDLTKVSTETTVVGGNGWIGSVTVGVGAFGIGAGADNNPSIVTPYDSTHVRLLGTDQTQNRAWSSSYLSLANPGINISFSISIPIVGWKSNESTNIAQSFTQAALVQSADSEVRLNTANGYGSTNTGVRRFTNITEQYGSAITYADSATLGPTFIINEAGIYAISYSDNFSNQATVMISRNSTVLNTITGIIGQVLAVAYTTTQNGSSETAAWTGYLNVGDIIRPQTDGSPNTTASQVQFTISKAGSLKQVNPQLNNKITIPTHQLRFEGATSKGSTDTYILKFTNQTITVGDGFSVSTTAANGTVVTIAKAGILSASACIYTTNAGGAAYLTKNQSNLTTSPSASESLSAGYGAETGGYQRPTWVGSVAIGDKIRIASGDSLGADNNVNFTLSLQEQSFPLAISNIWQQNGAGFNPDNVLLQQFDTAVLGDFTQTGLAFVIANALNGAKSAQLIHQSAINQSFKQVFAIAPKFRGKNLTLKHDVLSTCTSGNLTLTIYDETNATTLATSSVPTLSQSVTATVTNSSATLTSVSNAIINGLSVGMRVTGVNIPSNSYITALNSSAGTITISQVATGAGTAVRISGVVSIPKVSFDVPASCGSLSYTFTALPEANSPESYFDGMSIDITSQVLSSTSITLPVNNDYDWTMYTPAFSAGFGTVTGVTAYHRRVGDSIFIKARATLGTVAASVATMSFPGVLTSSSLIPTFETFGSVAKSTNNGTSPQWRNIIVAPNSSVLNFSGAGTTNSALTAYNGNDIFTTGDVISIQAGPIPVAGWLSNTTTSTTIPLTTAQLVQQPDSSLTVDTANGYGSTNTSIRRFTNIRNNIGSDIRYASDAVLGDSFTALTSGIYAISYTEDVAGVNHVAITKNEVTPTTAIVSMTQDLLLAQERITATTTAANMAWTGYLNAGDVIRAKSEGTASAGPALFTISKQGSLKQLNPSTDSKITIPTHQLRFEGCSTRGSTATAICKFDSQAITQGDAWSVVNDSVNGTVVTMKKAGKLVISGSVSGNGSDAIQITKNQATLTAVSSTASEIIMTISTPTTGFNEAFSCACDVVIGDSIRLAASSTPGASVRNVMYLSLTETSIPANFSNVLPQWSQSDSCIQLRTANGHGSTNTKIRRFSNTVQNLGSDIVYIDDAALGGYLTIQTDGTYTISYTDIFNTAVDFGITKNTTQPTVNLYSLTNPGEVLAAGLTPTANYEQSVTWQGFLAKGDVIRAHDNGGTTGSNGTMESKFTISKVGKPNLTSVDVTPFVNMKTTDTEFISGKMLLTNSQTNLAGELQFAIGALSTTNVGILSIVDDPANTRTKFVALKKCYPIVSYFSYIQTTGTEIYIYKNGSLYFISSQWSNGQADAITCTVPLEVGDYISVGCSFQSNGGNTGLTILATADNNATAAPTQQVSSDTMSFVFKSTAIDPAVDAIGTFNTYTYAANSNTPTIATSAPTQTTTSMNANGIALNTRGSDGTTTTATPVRFDIFIGKGLKSKQVDAYGTTAKATSICTDLTQYNSTSMVGANSKYNEVNGILTLEAAVYYITGTTTRYIGFDSAGNGFTTGYFVFNASKSPSLVTIPNLNQRTAYLSDVKANGTDGGTPTASAYNTRILNTIDDPNGIITSLASNQFTLSAGQYSIKASSLSYASGSTRLRIRNITDSTTPILGITNYNRATVIIGYESSLEGNLIITSSKVFELQHYFAAASSGNGFGIAAGIGESEVYTQIRITKIK